MDGTEVRTRGGATFRIEQKHLKERYPLMNTKSDPLLWWVQAQDLAYFGDDRFHEITGGCRTKRDAESAIEEHLKDAMSVAIGL